MTLIWDKFFSFLSTNPHSDPPSVLFFWRNHKFCGRRKEVGDLRQKLQGTLHGLDGLILKINMQKIILVNLFEMVIVRLNEVVSCVNLMISKLFYKSVIKAHITVVLYSRLVTCLINSCWKYTCLNEFGTL